MSRASGGEDAEKLPADWNFGVKRIDVFGLDLLDAVASLKGADCLEDRSALDHLDRGRNEIESLRSMQRELFLNAGEIRRFDVGGTIFDRTHEADEHTSILGMQLAAIRSAPMAAPSGNLPEDLAASLGLLARTLVQRKYDHLMAGVIERAAHDTEAQELRGRLYKTATSGIRNVLSQRLDPREVEPVLAMLVGAVLMRATYEGEPVGPELLADITKHVLNATEFTVS